VIGYDMQGCAALCHAVLCADCYMMFNAEEYWAEGCQSWFDATVRTDVNSGINTRDKLKAHDTHFAQLLEEVCVCSVGLQVACRLLP
jgi:hypothetical protein